MPSRNNNLKCYSQTGNLSSEGEGGQWNNVAVLLQKEFWT